MKSILTKGEATRLRNLLSKKSALALNHNETLILKRLLEKKDAENNALARSFQFRQ